MTWMARMSRMGQVAQAWWLAQRLRPLAAGVALAGAALAGPARAQGTCPPAGWTASELATLKAAKWQLPEAAARDALARALLACLAHPNPALRDGVAFEALSHWLRAKQLSRDTMLVLARSGLAQLKPTPMQSTQPASPTSNAADAGGFAQPFSALMLSEVARADRISPLFTEAERAALVDAAVHYLRGVRDRRGFVAGEGWRHGVAHGADLLMQLALNPAVGQIELQSIVHAVQTQVAPRGAHAYIHGESERLARPVLFALRRGLLGPAVWTAFIGELAAPAPLADWGSAFESAEGLARIHNLKAFLLVLHFNLREAAPAASATPPPGHEALLQAVTQALKALP